MGASSSTPSADETLRFASSQTSTHDLLRIKGGGKRRSLSPVVDGSIPSTALNGSVPFTSFDGLPAHAEVRILWVMSLQYSKIATAKAAVAYDCTPDSLKQLICDLHRQVHYPSHTLRDDQDYRFSLEDEGASPGVAAFYLLSKHYCCAHDGYRAVSRGLAPTIIMDLLRRSDELRAIDHQLLAVEDRRAFKVRRRSINGADYMGYAYDSSEDDDADELAHFDALGYSAQLQSAELSESSEHEND